jgi:hypothetical protein
LENGEGSTLQIVLFAKWWSFDTEDEDIMGHWRYVLLVMVLGFFGVHDAWAQSYRNAVQVPPVEVYQSMLSFVDRKEYSKVQSSLNVLAPIVDHIRAKFSVNPADDINRAVKKGNRDEVLMSVQALIMLDIEDLLDEALRQVDSSPDSAKTLVKTARLDYELLSPSVSKVEFSADQKIKKDFNDSFRVMGTESAYSTEKTAINTEQLKNILSGITSTLNKVFKR